MFTGIIGGIGEVTRVARQGDTRFTIACAGDPVSVAIGASIACSGCCLTVIDKGAAPRGMWFAVSASAETLSKTTLGHWKVGTRINLERALKAGDELGGHLVAGHVDGVGEIVSVKPEGDSQRFQLKVPRELARFIAPKGSVALDGTSLTVNEVEGETFGVNLIPHTLAVTTWGMARAGDPINVEIDLLARYVARLLDTQSS